MLSTSLAFFSNNLTINFCLSKINVRLRKVICDRHATERSIRNSKIA